jgi:hypothetical protein
MRVPDHLSGFTRPRKIADENRVFLEALPSNAG